jgi:ubiquinone biosynthesis protein COQ4
VQDASNVVESIADLPPPVSRRVQWRRLREQLSILNEGDPARVLDAAFSTGDALGGMSDERHLARLLKSASGRELIRSKVSLGDALADHGMLASMAPGSLGRAFLAFSQRHGIEVKALLESQHAMSRDYRELDPVRQWLRDRLTVMHDLWHVIAGYDATPPGESALMCFSLPQRINDRTLPIFVTMSVATGKISVRDAIAAIQRGRHAVDLPLEPMEELLPLPLAEARSRLGVRSPVECHPHEGSAGMLIPV